MAKSITYTALPDIPLIEPGDDLASIIAAALRRAAIEPRAGDVLVVAQKAVSKAEGRYLDLADVRPSARAREIAEATGKDDRLVEAILSESEEVLRIGRHVVIVAHRLGYVMANAGIDESNIPHPAGRAQVLLLPVDPDASAALLRSRLEEVFGTSLGVVVNDSFGRAWRHGVTGVALGAAGVPSLQNLVGEPDLFGRAMRVTEVAVADELAAGASLLMGQSDEGLPVIHVRGLGITAPSRPARDLVRDKAHDLFR